MKTFLSGLVMLFLAGCSSIPSYQDGDITIRTSQVRERTLKVMLYDQQGKRLEEATVRVTNNRGDLLQERNLRRRIAFIEYPMHESRIQIEAIDSHGQTGVRPFSRSQLREVEISK